MTTFLIKLDGRKHGPRGIVRPRSAADWEGGDIFVTEPPKTLSRRVTDPIHSGDDLLIWTHEGDDYGRGYGLTAQAKAGGVRPQDGSIVVNLKEVVLLRPYFGLKGVPKESLDNPVLKAVRGVEHDRTTLLASDELADLLSAIKLRQAQMRAAGLAAITMQAQSSPILRALAEEVEEVHADFERRFSCQEARPGQPAFRQTLLRVYEGRCVVTGCNVDEVLQACHIAGFARHVDLRTDVKNGLILRADTHALFDRSRLSIHPRRGQVVLAPSLRTGAYGKLHGRRVKHQADFELLGAHYKFFLAKWPGSLEN